MAGILERRPRTLIPTRRAAALTAILIIAGAVLSGTAWANTESAGTNEPGSVPVNATLTYQVTRDPTGMFVEGVSEVQLGITRGTDVYRQPVTSQLPNCSENTCWPQVLSGWGPSLQVVRLEPGPEPNALVHLWSGGAHCCFIDQIFSWNPTTSTYSQTERSWGDPRARLVDLRHNGQVEFLTADDRFANAFACFACSGLPVQIFIFRSGAFVDVSRAYPAAITADARIQFRTYLANLRRGARQRGQTGQTAGFMAAWVADEYRLGKRAHALRTLTRENRLGHLHGGKLDPRGAAYVRQLLRFLRQNGYG